MAERSPGSIKDVSLRRLVHGRGSTQDTLWDEFKLEGGRLREISYHDARCLFRK